MKRLARFKDGEELTPKRLNELVDAINVVASMQVGPGLSLLRSPGAMRLDAIPQQVMVARTGGSGIPARSSETPGSATVTLRYKIGGVYVAGPEVTCDNWSTTAIGNSRNILVAPCGSDYVVVAEDCPTP
jgi:hypothetical protein